MQEIHVALKDNSFKCVILHVYGLKEMVFNCTCTFLLPKKGFNNSSLKKVVCIVLSNIDYMNEISHNADVTNKFNNPPPQPQPQKNQQKLA